ncbi:hypothetical protein ACFL7D_04565 [candidate division KSB1 bacterium]
MSGIIQNYNIIRINLPKTSAVSSGSVFPDFQKGDIINGKVLDILSSSKYVLQINGKNYLSESRSPLKTGLTYSFSVQSISSGLSLKLLNTKYQFGSFEKQFDEILKQLDIKTNKFTGKIVAQLFKLNYPLSKGLIQTIFEEFNQINKKKLLDDDVKLNYFIHIARKKLSNRSGAYNKIWDFINTTEREVKEYFESVLKERVEYSINSNAKNNQKSVSENEKSINNILEYTIELLKSKDSEFKNYLELLLDQNLISNKSIRNLILIARLLSIYQNTRLINYGETPDHIYYFPIFIPLQNDFIGIEIFYQNILYSLVDNDEAGFLVHLLIRVKDSKPLHITIEKKIRNMLHIRFNDPDDENLKLLKDKAGSLRLALKRSGYKLIKFSYNKVDTTDPSYKNKLFTPGTTSIRSINFKG